MRVGGYHTAVSRTSTCRPPPSEHTDLFLYQYFTACFNPCLVINGGGQFNLLTFVPFLDFDSIFRDCKLPSVSFLSHAVLEINASPPQCNFLGKLRQERFTKKTYLHVAHLREELEPLPRVVQGSKRWLPSSGKFKFTRSDLAGNI